MVKTTFNISKVQNVENDNTLTKLKCARPTQQINSVAHMAFYAVSWGSHGAYAERIVPKSPSYSTVAALPFTAQRVRANRMMPRAMG